MRIKNLGIIDLVGFFAALLVAQIQDYVRGTHYGIGWNLVITGMAFCLVKIGETIVMIRRYRRLTKP